MNAFIRCLGRNLQLVAVVGWWLDRDILWLLLVFVLSGIGRMISAVMLIMLLKPPDLKRFLFDKFRRLGVT